MIKYNARNARSIYSQLGSPLDDIINTAVNKGEQAAQTYVNNLNVQVGGSSHPWIPAQNKAASDLSTIVANYVRVKNAGQLTANYIANAITQTQGVTQGFARFASQYSDPGAQRGSNEITNNGNAVIQNMRQDLAQVPVGTISTTVGNLLNPITDATGMSSTALLIMAALFFLPKLLKR